MSLPLLAANDPTDIALVDSDEGRQLTYGDLQRETAHIATVLRAFPRRVLAFCFCSNRAQIVCAYLGVIESGHAIALLDEGLAPEFKRKLLELYSPEIVISAAADTDFGFPLEGQYRIQETIPGLTVWIRDAGQGGEVHADLAVLLSTSGSTGTPKFVRLTIGNLEANANSIRQALGIDAGERPISSLPIHYSYGLSVLNSHLAAGARIVLTNKGLTSQHFWSVFREHNCTSFAGVPYSYQILRRLGIDRLAGPTLRTLTQAGGKLGDDLVAHFHGSMAERGGRFFVMYGQTEATARIAILPWNELPQRLGAAGRAIPGGSLSIRLPDGVETTEAGKSGELVYRGPNVMMGYACSRHDLRLGDELRGVLHTGDLGYLDPDGYVYIQGRTRRDSKVFGIRVNLDEVEQLVRVEGSAAVVEDKDNLLIFCEYGDDSRYAELRRELAGKLRLHVGAFRFRRVAALPLNTNGKIDYERLKGMARDS